MFIPSVLEAGEQASLYVQHCSLAKYLQVGCGSLPLPATSATSSLLFYSCPIPIYAQYCGVCYGEGKKI